MLILELFNNQMEQKGSNLASTLCTRGCGFYGNPAFEGMCSKCYKDTIKRSQLDPSPTMLSPVSTSEFNFFDSCVGVICR